MTILRLLLTTAFLSTIVALSAPGELHAQTDAQEKAAELYKEGVEAYFAADYAVAITKYREGFQLDPNAMFLYNLSLCFSKLGNFPEALDHAARADEMGGMPDDVTTRNLGRLAAFGILVSAEQLATDVVTAPENSVSAGCMSDAECQSGATCDVATGQCIASSDPPASDGPLSPLGWAGAGVGVLGLGMTTAAIVISASLNDDIEEHRRLVEAEDPEASELATTIRRRQGTGRVFLIGGLATTIVGGGLLAYDLFLSDGAETARWFPIVTPDGVGVGTQWRF